jgi:hypothetical protein
VVGNKVIVGRGEGSCEDVGEALGIEVTVGAGDGLDVGNGDGVRGVGTVVGGKLGRAVGIFETVGSVEGFGLGTCVTVGIGVGLDVGDSDGFWVGSGVGGCVGA